MANYSADIFKLLNLLPDEVFHIKETASTGYGLTTFYRIRADLSTQHLSNFYGVSVWEPSSYFDLVSILNGSCSIIKVKEEDYGYFLQPSYIQNGDAALS